MESEQGVGLASSLTTCPQSPSYRSKAPPPKGSAAFTNFITNQDQVLKYLSLRGTLYIQIQTHLCPSQARGHPLMQNVSSPISEVVLIFNSLSTIQKSKV